MNAADEIAYQVRALVAACLGTSATHIGGSASFNTDLGADSLDMVRLIMDIEDEFDIDIPDEDAAQLLTVEQLIEYVQFATAASDAGEKRQAAAPLGAANY